MSSGSASTRSDTRRRLSAGERRQRIAQAAAELFADRGYSAPSVDDIARSARISPSVIYDHFPSKEGLYRHVLTEEFERLIDDQRRAVVSAPPGRRRLRAAIEALLAWVEENPASWRLIFREVGGPPAIVAAQEAVQARATRTIAGHLIGLPAGEDGPYRSLSPQVLLVTEFLKGGTNAVARWWCDRDDVPRDSVVTALVELCWSGIGPLGTDGRLQPPTIQKLRRASLARGGSRKSL